MLAQKIAIKPLSVNDCWKGRRFSTDQYKFYQKHLSLLLKNENIPKSTYKLYLEWGFSSKASDWDNPIKPCQDILQKHYGFNDNAVYESNVKKFIVPKGQEYLAFKLEYLDLNSEEYKKRLVP